MTKIPIALELYSVRDQAAADLFGVLKAVAKMGYAGVEFAEPQGGKSPWRDYVEKYGAAMHHLGIAANVSIPETVSAFDQLGGAVLLSAPGGTTTFVDLKSQPMAVAIEIGQPPKN